MYYFGRIIGAFFNQLFRFLFWNKFGQKILIAIIILLIAFWCVGMTEVHAVEEVEDINYKVYNYYDNIMADFIFRLNGALEKEDVNALQIVDLINQGQALYLCYGSTNGGSYNNAYPLSRGYLCFSIGNNSNLIATATATSSDYMSVTGFTQYSTNYAHKNYRFTSNGTLELLGDYSTGDQTIYFPLQLFNRKSDLFTEYMNAYNNGDTQAIIQLLEDIKAEQQATNEFLNEQIDESGISVQAPQVTDTTSENMSNNLHTQINTLTSQLQTTVNNYYEGWNAYVWTIPLPQYIGGNISFDSGVTRRIIGSNGVVFNVIQAIWVVLFGGYIVGFIKRMLDWVQTGKIFDEGGLADFIWWMDTNNEIIKASMM